MATPKIVRVQYDIDTQSVTRTAAAWQEVADNTDEAQREAKAVGDEYKKQVGIVGKLEEKERALMKERRESNDPKRIKAINDELRNTQNELQRVTGRTKSVGASFKSLLAPLAALATAAAAFNFAKNAIQGAIRYEQLAVSFEVFLGSAEKATQVLAKLDKFSLRTPFTPTQVQDAGRALLAFGVPVDDLETKLQQIGDTSAATGKDFNELAVIFGKARTAGVLMGEDVNQLVEAGIPVVEEFAKIMGTTPDQVKKLASESKITFPILEQAFENMTGAGGKFNGLMDKLADTTGGKLSTLQGYFDTISRSIGQSLLPVVNGVVGAFSSLLSRLTDTRTESERLFDEYQAGNKKFKETEERLGGLSEEYENLTGKSELNKAEQYRLQTVIKQLAAAVPLAVTEFDKYGNALAINTGAVGDNIEKQRELLKLQSSGAITAAKEEVMRLSRLLGDQNKIIQTGKVAQSDYNAQLDRFVTVQRDATQSELVNAQNSKKVLLAALAQEAVRLDQLGYELNETVKANANAVTGQDLFTKATEDATKATTASTGAGKANSDALKEQEKAAKAAADALKEFEKTQAEVLERSKQIAGNATQPGSFARMTAEVSRLKAELDKLSVGSEGFNAVAEDLRKAEALMADSKLAAEMGLTIDAYKELMEATKAAEDEGAFTGPDIPDGKSLFEKIFGDPEKAAAAVAIYESTLQTIDAAFQIGQNNRLAAIDEEMERRLAGVKGNAEAEAAIQAEFAAKREEQEKKYAKNQQTRALALAFIESALNVIKALGTPPAPNFLLAAVAAAAGIAQITTIKAQKFAEGGLVEGGQRGRDSVPALLMPGERVMTVDAVKRFGPMLELMHKGIMPRELLAPGMPGMVAMLDSERIEGAISRAGRAQLSTAERQLKELRRFNRRGQMPGTNLN